MRATLVHNPDSGLGQHSAKALMATLEEAGYSPVYVWAKDPTLSKALSRAKDLVIAAGGDGTVTRVVTQIPDRDIPVAILPLGTANNVARSLGIGGSIESILESWRNAKQGGLDVGLAEGKWGERRFIEAVGLGALADVTATKERPDGSLEERVSKGRQIFRAALKRAKPVKVDIALDDDAVKGEMLLVEIMNTNCVGPSLCLAPAADPGDGRLDVVFLPADARKAMLAWLDSQEGEPPVFVRNGRRIVINKGGSLLRVGDKARPKEGDVVVAIEHGAAAILLPPEERSEEGSEKGKRKGKKQ